MDNKKKIIPIEIVQLPQSLYNSMMEFAQQHPHNEVIGIFFGKIIPPHTLLIEAVYPMRVGHSAEVEFTDEDYERTFPIMKEEEKNGRLWLGWFHSHPFTPGDHLYMSKKDIAHHFAGQTINPYWTALVLNPHQVGSARNPYGIKAFRLKFFGEKRPFHSFKFFKKKSRTTIPALPNVSKKVVRLKIKIINF